MNRLPGLLLSALVTALSCFAGVGWPQFRGPDGLGLARAQNPPLHFGPESNVVWKIALPPGLSSPCIWEDRIFLTSFENQILETLCIRRSDGQMLWRKAAPSDRIERFHQQEGSPAASTPVTDGRRVYVYFGSCGLLCYDFDGEEQWRAPLPPAQSFGGFGTGTSPVLADGLIIVNRDQVGGSQVLAFEAATGKLAWSTDRGQSYGWCSPAIWEHDGIKEVILPASTILRAYDLRTGVERWTVRGLAAATCATPVSGGGLCFVSSWSPAEAGNVPPPFGAVLEKSDKDRDGALSPQEVEGTELRAMFDTFDLNRDKRITRDEYDPLRSLTARSRNALLAVRPGGAGDITETHVAWSQTRGLPYVPSPLFYDGRLYLVKDGGMISCFDAQTGKPHYLQERLGAPGSYYASPVAAGGRIYTASLQGVVTVVAGGDALNVLARNDLGERISATSAIVDNTLYLRTAQHLFAFAQLSSPASTAATDELLLFDGHSLKGWRESDFSGSGKVEVKDGQIVLGLGFMTGITWTNEPPRTDYEITLEAMRLDGSDFFCGLTFPVDEDSCSLIVGGWGGNIVGLSTLDYADAANNETTQFLQFSNDQWYQIRVRVESGKIQAWIDQKQVVDLKTTERKIGIRSECAPSLPLGIAAWSTKAALRNIRLRLH